MYSLDFADCNIFLDPPLLAHSVTDGPTVLGKYVANLSKYALICVNLQHFFLDWMLCDYEMLSSEWNGIHWQNRSLLVTGYKWLRFPVWMDLSARDLPP